jgi:hypothetical protein
MVTRSSCEDFYFEEEDHSQSHWRSRSGANSRVWRRSTRAVRSPAATRNEEHSAIKSGQAVEEKILKDAVVSRYNTQTNFT